MHKLTVTTAIVCITALKLTAAEQPSILYLLDKYAEAQDKRTSFIVKSEVTIFGESSYSGRWKHLTGTKEKAVLCEFRTDGERGYRSQLAWGNVPGWNRGFTKEDARYVSFLWDGSQYIRNSYAPGKFYASDHSEDVAMINRTDAHAEGKSLAQGGDISSALEGYLDSYGRIDHVLRRALQDQGDSVFLQDSMEKVGGADCYVIEAVTKFGKYKVWLDPTHGYNVAKAELRKGGSDLLNGKPMPEGLTWYHTLENVRFEKIDDVWIPVEADEGGGRKNRLGGYSNTMTHVKRTEFILNPDHDALGSFLPTDLRNGAQVNLSDVSNITYRWYDGELVPEIDEFVVDELNKMTEKVMARTHNITSDVNGLSATATNEKPEEATVSAFSFSTASDLLDRYRETQGRLSSFVVKGESTIEKNGRKGITTSEFVVDEDKVAHRCWFWDGLVRTENKADYKSFLWNGENLIEYRRVGNLNNSIVFIRNNDAGKNEMIATEYKGAPLLGFCGGDYERIDSVLTKADKLLLRDKTDKIGRSQCYVIDAVTKRGNYTVWIDPGHGYNIAKMEVQRQKGNVIYDGESLESGMSFSLTNVRFEKIDNVWIPMEADMQLIEEYPRKVTMWHYRRLQMTLNPNHDVLRSFVADDIQNGTTVLFPEVSKIEHKWQNGKPIMEVGPMDK